jgi:hypothetical protein
MKYGKTFFTMLATALLALLFVGCSSNNPIDSTATVSSPITGNRLLDNGEPVQFTAKVATANNEMRMLTFEGVPDTVVAAQNCIIVRFNNENEAPIPFSDIHQGDSLNMQGTRQQDGYVYAHRIQVCTPTEGGYDIAFRDTITAIDYAAGSFTVANHIQIIMIDSNTYIWGNISHDRMRNRVGIDDMTGNNSAGKVTPNANWDTVLTFTDLEVGDIVEVRANIVDSSTFLAVSIKLANCESKQRCVIFNAHLATIDVDTRIVTFNENPWIAWVCNGAQLTALDGAMLTLADFNVGDYVAIKGVPITADSLKVSQMSITE